MLSLRERLERGVVVIDGAMGTSIHKLDLALERDFLGLENCCEILNATRPEEIQKIHESFLAVGCDAVETNSFSGSPLVLAEFGIAERCRELAAAAGRLARAACAAYSTPEQPRYALGSMGPGT